MIDNITLPLQNAIYICVSGVSGECGYYDYIKMKDVRKLEK
jgi:hypothetical protein